jgi:hypothetical protein
MTARPKFTPIVLAMALLGATLTAAPPQKAKPKPKTPAAPAVVEQKNDEGYTAKIREYTTEKFFLTELVDHLPASDTVPTPEKVLGYIAGAPDHLTYSKDIYSYMRALEKASPRVKVFSMGQTEEGREMMLVAVSDEANIAKLDRYKEINAKLADPRKTTDAEAEKLIAEGLPMYWATGSLHSTETGSPEMLMELAYRLAVEETPFIQAIRKNSIVLITPVLEVDGHDKEVDVYRYGKANPNKPPMRLIYWGKYVAHDNNRDGIGMALAITRNTMKAFLDWHPQVMHDLHESVPFLYISTGTGPYNAWLDPMVINEWYEMAYYEIDQMTKRGVPGIWTHGFYDGWAANYLFYVANGHNSIGRFYETFGNGGADTRDRTVPANNTSKEWYRPNPPLPRVKWSMRNNTNLEESTILFAMNMVANQKQHFMENFWLKGKRSVAKATTEGPAAYVIPGDDPRPGQAADLVNLMHLQGVEVHKTSAPVEVTMKQGRDEKKVTIPANSYVIRMDQPYSRMADMLLDTQFYKVSDPRPYDDTGWTLGPLRNVTTLRVTDTAILKAAMTPVNGDVKAPGGIRGSASTAAYVVNHNADVQLATFRYRLADVKMSAAEDAFKAAGRDFAAGSFIIKTDGNPSDLRDRLDKAANDLGVVVYALDEAPKVAAHTLAAPRIALVHTWGSTQNEGWVRLALDSVNVPYSYISDAVLRNTPDLRSKYDVIVFGPTPGASQRLVNGSPMRGEAVPWQKTELTPNIGTSPDQTDDTRGGMGLEGVVNLKRFIEAGGLFITIGGNASIPIDYGLIDGVSISDTRELNARGSIFNAVFADKKSPIAYGYGDKLGVYFSQAPVLQVSGAGGGGFGGGGGRGGPGGPGEPGGPGGAAAQRDSGRGSLTDPDVIQGRPPVAAPPRGAERAKPEDEMPAGMRASMPGPAERPRVVLRFAEERDLLISGMLAGGRELANRPAVVDVPLGKGHIVMFANNPMWRQQTQGSFFLVFNAMMNYDNLGVGLPKETPQAKPSDDMEQ